MKTLRLWLILAAFSVAVVPVVVFLGGLWLAGPYEGDGGIFGMMAEIYGDALTGRTNALLLLFSPVLLVVIWVAAFRARRALS